MFDLKMKAENASNLAVWNCTALVSMSTCQIYAKFMSLWITVFKVQQNSKIHHFTLKIKVKKYPRFDGSDTA